MKAQPAAFVGFTNNMIPAIVSHIAVVQDLVAHGMDIRGYTYWSFVDNLEWVEGYDLKFGLFGSDPTTRELERTPKPGQHLGHQPDREPQHAASRCVGDVHPGLDRLSDEAGPDRARRPDQVQKAAF
jgi:Glycosyl hydrolase family 1